MQVKFCAICEEKEKIKLLYPATFNVKELSASTFSARRTPDRMHYAFVKCQRCGLVFSNPIFSPNEITNWYRKSTFDYPTESEFLKKTYGGYLEKIIGSQKKKHIRLLDIGCGNGFFLEEAKKRGVDEVFGVEPGKNSVSKAPRWLQKKITVDIFRKGLFKENTFDIITCFHTLDHIPDPNIFLKIAFSFLKKGGKFLCIVHNTDGLSVKLFGEKSPIFDIEHIYLFNKPSLAKLFEKNKYSVKEVFDVINTYNLSYWFRMVPFPKIIKDPILLLLQKSTLGNIPVSMSAGNIGIIAEK